MLTGSAPDPNSLSFFLFRNGYDSPIKKHFVWSWWKWYSYLLFHKVNMKIRDMPMTQNRCKYIKKHDLIFNLTINISPLKMNHYMFEMYYFIWWFSFLKIELNLYFDSYWLYKCCLYTKISFFLSVKRADKFLFLKICTGFMPKKKDLDLVHFLVKCSL